MFVTNFLFLQNQWFFQFIKVFFAKLEKKRRVGRISESPCFFFFTDHIPVKHSASLKMESKSCLSRYAVCEHRTCTLVAISKNY